MLWSLQLPFEITCLCLFTICLLIFVKGLISEKNVGKVIVFSFTTGVVLFLPIFIITNTLADAIRFGESHYPSVDVITDPNVKGYIPAQAKNIDILTANNRTTVWYNISESSLRQNIATIWAAHNPKAFKAKNFQSKIPGEIVRRQAFKDVRTGWNDSRSKENIIVFETPLGTGAGDLVIYFDCSKKLAYQNYQYF